MTDGINSSFPLSTISFSTIINNDMIMVESAVEAPLPIWVGFIGCIVASLFFGSNLVPVKQFSAGDGFFFQFVSCVTIFIVGLIIDIIINNQRFYPLVMIGGRRICFYSFSPSRFLIEMYRCSMEHWKSCHGILYKNMWSYCWNAYLGNNKFNYGLG
jgi:hypothetical protein